jgi:hypothetical protein
VSEHRKIKREDKQLKDRQKELMDRVIMEIQEVDK